MTDNEKLLKLRKLADAMYYAAQYLTTDASGLRKAMDEYHQFIIHEYHKEEPIIPDIIDEHWWKMLGEEPVSEDLMSKIKKFTDNYFPIIDNGINIPARNELRDIFSGAARMGAQWQREKYLSNIDIDAIWGELVCRDVYKLTRADVEEFVERLKEGKYDKRTD